MSTHSQLIRTLPLGTSQKHRSDIDGLRAVAVLAVVAYHAGIQVIHGGFVGVDIFFVISGYLITQIIVADVTQGRFSLFQFYERRVRRIAPALIAVLIAASILSYRYLLPGELIDFSKSLIAAALSASNVYFWQTSGYFDAPASSKPLLHTWSLAVEEQFYLAWPLLILLAHKVAPNRMLALAIAGGLISLIYSAIGVFQAPAASFYLVHARAFELLTGAVLALGAFPKPLTPVTRNVVSVAGIALIVLSVFGISVADPFPGILAVLPCLGAMLVILGGRDGQSIVGRVLSWRPIAFIGLISYSLYLCHWPIIVFQKNFGFLIGGHSDRTQKLVMIVCSLVVATLSWKYVEQPFRTGSSRPGRRPLFWIAGVSLGAMSLAGASSWSQRGFPSRYTTEELKIASYIDLDIGQQYRVGKCFLVGQRSQERFSAECLALSPTKQNYLLLGDSHAAELWDGLRIAYPRINFLQATAPDCFPTLHHDALEALACKGHMNYLFKDPHLLHTVNMVVIAARWNTAVLPRLDETLLWMNDLHIPVTLIGPTVEYDSPLPRLIVTGIRRNDPSFPDKHWDLSLRTLDARMAQLAHKDKARYVSMLDLSCNAGACITTDKQGMPLLIDREHYTPAGSLLIARKMRLGLR